MLRTSLFLLTFLVLTAAPGIVAAENDHATLEDTRGGVVHNTTGNCVRTQWESDGDVCAPSEPPPPPKPSVVVMPPPPPAPPPPPVKHTVISETARTVYFPYNKAGLTEEAKAQLDALAETLKAAKDIEAAKILGATDRIGSTGYNEKLSQKRAEAVRDYLIARGYTNASVTKTRWVGKSEPVTSCPKKMPHKKLVKCLQGDRRVHIEIAYKTETVTPAAAPTPAPALHTPAEAPPPPMPVMPTR